MHGNYWIGNKEKNKKVINIEGQKGKWKVTSNELYQIINPKNVIVDKDGISVRKNKSLILKEFTFRLLAMMQTQSQSTVEHLQKLKRVVLEK